MSTRLEVSAALILRLMEGDESAFRTIYELLHGRIYRMMLALVKDTEKAEELLQETFVSLWIHRGSLSPEQPLYPFVYLTARRLAIDWFRKRLAEQTAMAQLAENEQPHTNETEEAVLTADLDRIAQERIGLLPAQQRQVFLLSREEGLSYEEIAQRLHLSPNTVRNHMVCALKALRLHFRRHGVTFAWLALMSWW